MKAMMLLGTVICLLCGILSGNKEFLVASILFGICGIMLKGDRS